MNPVIEIPLKNEKMLIWFQALIFDSDNTVLNSSIKFERTNLGILKNWNTIKFEKKNRQLTYTKVVILHYYVVENTEE